MNIVAQIFGVIALIVYCYTLQLESKGKILRFLLITNVFYCLQYLMLDAYSALFACFIGVVRSIIFLKFEKENKKVSVWILLLIIAITLYSGFLSYNNIISLIPIITSIMYTTAVWQPNLKIFRVNSIFNASAWIFYNFKVGAYVSIVASMIELIVGIIAIIRLDIAKQKSI